MYFLDIRLLFFLLVFISFNSMAYEEANYTLVYKNDIYEIRNYSDRLAIQVSYSNQSDGFRKLFNYISGSNINSKKINMTTPVTQSNEFSMTTPITESNQNELKVMQFFLPSNFTINNAPLPIDKEVKLVIIEQGYFAVKQYSGPLSDKNFERHRNILQNNLLKDDIKILSSGIKAIYNGPFTLPFLRRNEAMYRIVWDK